MIKIVGDNIGVSLPEIQDDLTLFMDIRGQSLDKIAMENPVTTYIVTTKSLEQARHYICAGFYNLMYGCDPKTLTLKTIVGFLNTKYEDNRIKLVVDNLVPLYNEYGSAIGCINGLLSSIKSGDLLKFSQLVQYNLPTMQDSIAMIELMYGLSKAFYDNRSQLEEMRTATDKLATKDMEILQYKSRIDELNTRVADIQVDFKALTEQYKQAQAEIAKLMAKGNEVETVTSHPVYLELMSAFNQVKDELAATKAENTGLRATSGISLTNNDGNLDGKDQLILRLREELAAAQSVTWDATMLKRIPAVTKSVSLQAKKILYFKEIRPAVYVNSLIFWLDVFLKKSITEPHGKSYLILVFDQLVDQYTCQKYSKRNWALNGQPNANTSVVVTNEVSLDFLKGTLNIQAYDFLIVIDRFHLFADVFDTPTTERFYLINTPNDIVDFKLDPNRCIGFFEWSKEEYDENGKVQVVPDSSAPPCKYLVYPTDIRLARAATETRAYKMVKDGFWRDILKGAGILDV